MPSQIEKKTVFYKWNMKTLLHFETFQPIIKSSEGEKTLPTMHRRHRFSAFWLRSKCSICSYQLNIWYGLHSRSRILNWFLTDWVHGWACSPESAGCHGLALHPCVASSSWFITVALLVSSWVVSCSVTKSISSLQYCGQSLGRG